MEDLLATRTKLRSKATKQSNELRSCREGDRGAPDPDQLALKLHHLEKLQSELKGIQLQLDQLGQTDDTGHMRTIEDELFLGARLLARLDKAEEAQSKANAQNVSGNTDLKSLLTVKIPTKHGDVMKWSEFWELFAISVHDNPRFVKA